MAMSRQPFFCFNATSETLRENLRTFIVAGNINLFEKPWRAALTADSDMQLNNTQYALLCFHCNNGYAVASHFYDIRTWPILLDIKTWYIW